MNKIAISIIVILSLFVLMSHKKGVNKEEHVIRESKYIEDKKPPCLSMHFNIEKYADSFNIPKRYAYGIAYMETKYQGPFHWEYNHKQTSNAGALGPMQVMLSTARGLNKDKVTRDRLKNNIEYNVMTSMKLLRRLYNLRGSWAVAFGEYNTGKPCINGYANQVINHKINWKNGNI